MQLVGCNIFTELCNYHHYLILEHFHHLEKKITVVHFTCQLAWGAVGCPDTRSNIILSVSVKVVCFLSLFVFVHLSKKLSPLNKFLKMGLLAKE